jgi:hypothetical protein
MLITLADLMNITQDEVIKGGIAAAAFSFLWLKFQQNYKRIEKRIEVLEAAAVSSSGFISGVCGAAMMGDQVPSKLIYDLHDQHKPADSSGIHKSLPKPVKYPQ